MEFAFVVLPSLSTPEAVWLFFFVVLLFVLKAAAIGFRWCRRRRNGADKG